MDPEADALHQALISQLSSRQYSIYKQTVNTHRQRLRNLLSKEGRPVPPDLNNTCVSLPDVSLLLNSSVPRNSTSQQSNLSPTAQPAKQKRCRRFLPRTQYRRKIVRLTKIPITPLASNFSDFSFEGTKCESLLNLGLNFVPTPKSVNTNIRWFNRSVRWAEFFCKDQADTDTSTSSVTEGPPQIFKNIKTTVPKSPQPRHLQTFLDAVHDDILLAPLNKISPNISSEHKASVDLLVSAQRRREVTLKPNDKSGGCSLLNVPDYISTCHEHLYSTFKDENGQEQPYYRQKVPGDVLRHHWAKIKDAVDEGVSQGFVHPEDVPHLVQPEPKPGTFYGLVKNHVDPTQWTGPIPPLRPIVSAFGSNTEVISHFVDEHAKKEVTKLESWLEDTRHLLQNNEEENEKGPQPPGSIPVTLDISGMYTNVPWGEGMIAFKEAMDNREDTSIPTVFLLQLLMLVLSCNLFVFDSVLFFQLFGFAMGSRVAPTFACIFMGWLEVRLLQAWRGLGGVQPYLWRRYIDDIIFFWRGSEEELLHFVDFLNQFHPTIKFKCKRGANYDFETRKVDFLDTTIWIDDNGFIQSTLYTKPSRVVQFLSPSSSHPSHITQNIPFSMAYRLRRIESTEPLFQANLLKLGTELLQRGYRKQCVSAAFSKVKVLTRASTLEKVAKPVCDRLILVIPFDKRLPNISGILHHRWQCLLARDPEAKNYMPKPPMVAYSRTKSLRDTLVKSKLPPTSQRKVRQAQIGYKKCGGKSNCSVCSHYVNSTTHRCNFTTETFPINCAINCSTTGVVYSVTCNKQSGECGKVGGLQYVGNTTRPGKVRFGEHLGSVTQPSQESTTKPVGVHFRSPGHTHANMVFLPVEKIRSKDKFVMEARESYWIDKYKSVKVTDSETIEHGLNLKQ